MTQRKVAIGARLFAPHTRRSTSEAGMGCGPVQARKAPVCRAPGYKRGPSTLPLAAVLAVLGALAVASTASAATRTLNFDELPAGTGLGNQYVSQGVEFRRSPSGPNQGGGGRVANRPQTTRSDPNAVEMSRCGVEVCPAPDLWAAFSAGHGRVTAYVGGNGSFVAGVNITMTMRAYDLAGNLVTQSSATFNQGDGAFNELTVTRAQGDIRYVNMTATPSFLFSFDDFSFDVPDPPPPPPGGGPPPPPPPPAPDFAIGKFGFDGFALEPGRTATAELVLRRENGSAGPLSLAASGLPPGVSMDFAPNPIDGPDGTKVQMTVRVSPEAPGSGAVPVTVTATPGSAATGPAARSFTFPVTILRPVNGFDLRTKGIEVTQGVQQPGFLIPTAVQGPGGEYRGVRLVADRRTIVRVYAEAIGAPPGGVPGAGMLLSGIDERTGKALPEGPLVPVGAPSRLGPTQFPGVSPADRASGPGAYTFALPTSWARGSIRLTARAIEPADSVFAGQINYDECTQPACLANNEYALNRIEFTPTRVYRLDVLELVTKNTTGPLPRVEDVFSGALAVMPAGEGRFQVRGPRAVITNRDTSLNAATQEWFDDNPSTRGDAAMGIEWPTAGSGRTEGGTAIANGKRPFTAVAHELFHLLGRPHASAGCGGADPSKPNDGNNRWDPWPPDEKGLIQGVGLDRRTQYGPNAFEILATGFPTPATEVFDLMSYCAPNNPDSNVWLSPRNWEATLDFLAPRSQARAGGGPQASAAASDSAAARPALSVTAEVGPAGARIVDVMRVPAGAGAGPGSSPYRLVARNAAGATVSEVAMNATGVHEPRSTVLRGSVPAGGVASVAVVLGGQVIAQRAASRAAPKVSLLAPAPGRETRIAGKGAFAVRWRATDADGDPIVVRVDHSLDGGRTWQEVASSDNGGTIAVPKGLFAQSARGRVRVTASDGFNETVAVSGRVRSVGRAPRVSIADPGPGARVPADGTLTLIGSAQDDRFAQIPGSRLTWYDGRRALGRGSSLTTSGALSPGLRTLRLVAGDRGGRTGAASVRLRVLPVVPRFLAVRAPARISRRARSVKLRVQATVAATLRVAGRRMAVDRKLRTLAIPVKAGSSPLVLSLRLQAGRLASGQTVTVPRA